MFFIGLPGTDFDELTSKLLNEIKPGGVCLFARNTKRAEDTRKLLDGTRERLSFEPFLSLDQEGGLVDRLRRILEPMPSAKDVGKTDDLSVARRLAEITAEAVRMLGFNMNFAPVIDVIDDSREGFVMDSQCRTFGRGKEEVAKYTSTYLKSLQSGGCLGCLKHFPGIGGVQFDPHEELPAVQCGLEDLYERDLYPFIKHFETNNIYSIMTGHTVFPSLDLQEIDSNGKLLPSSLSSNIVSGFLRDELGFDGLALTDDLEMGAIINNYGIGAAAKMAVQAGNDFVLICNHSEAIFEGFEGVLKAVEDGDISESRIDQSLERIWRVRAKLKPPLEFRESKLDELSQEIKILKESL